MMTWALDLVVISSSEMQTEFLGFFPGLLCKNLLFLMHNLVPVLSKPVADFPDGFMISSIWRTEKLNIKQNPLT